MCLFPWQPLLRKHSFIISKPLLAAALRNEPRIWCVSQSLSVSPSQQRPRHKANKTSSGCVIYFFFSLNAQSESSCWHSLPWVLSPLTCKFALCLFVCWTQGALPPLWVQQPQAGWVSWGRADHGLLCVLQRSPRSAARTAMSSSSPSWTCGATRSTAAAPWGPCTRASVTRSSRKASEMDRSTSARTVRGCSPTNTGTHRHPDPPLASPLRPGQRGMMGKTEGINLSFLHGNLSFLRRV